MKDKSLYNYRSLKYLTQETPDISQFRHKLNNQTCREFFSNVHNNHINSSPTAEQNYIVNQCRRHFFQRNMAVSRFNKSKENSKYFKNALINQKLSSFFREFKKNNSNNKTLNSSLDIDSIKESSEDKQPEVGDFIDSS